VFRSSATACCSWFLVPFQIDRRRAYFESFFGLWLMLVMVILFSPLAAARLVLAGFPLLSFWQAISNRESDGRRADLSVCRYRTRGWPIEGIRAGKIRCPAWGHACCVPAGVLLRDYAAHAPPLFGAPASYTRRRKF
jgi:hypothetical protein